MDHQHHAHDHHAHDHDHHHEPRRRHSGPALVIRPTSGISGDIIVAGLLALSGLSEDDLKAILDSLNLGHLKGHVRLEPRMLDSVGGVGLHVDLPHEHEHRNLADMEDFFERAQISDRAKSLALTAFRLLAEAEGAVHGLPAREVHFHEVGALDSMLDFGLAAVLFDHINPGRVVCGPLPICDGVISCRHGLLPAPAPAVLRLLEGVPVVGLPSKGETVTPTGLALLKAFNVEFGLWPALSIVRHALVYGTRRLEGVPNGAIFALGSVA